MSKKFSNVAQLCASLILGFTHGVFAADPNAILMNIPPPPSLQNPTSESRPAAAYGSANDRSATVGTNKKASSSSSAPVATANKGKGRDTGRAASNQNANTANKTALRSPEFLTTTWTFQQMPAENTMYTTPSRK